MKRADFIADLIEMGYEVTPKAGTNFVFFPYEIRVGRLAGAKIQMALEVVDLNPPPGPHVSPHLVPINPTNAQPHPIGGVHQSPGLGSEWQYWSRPYPNWNNDRSARAYMAHITTLFATL
jgi:hypothetical protein